MKKKPFSHLYCLNINTTCKIKFMMVHSYWVEKITELNGNKSLSDDSVSRNHRRVYNDDGMDTCLPSSNYILLKYRMKESYCWTQ